MDSSMIKPSASSSSNPLNFFLDFLKLRNPFCFKYAFFSTSGLGEINEEELSILFFIQSENNYTHTSKIYYHEYVNILFKKEYENTISAINEQMEDCNNAVRIDKLVHLRVLLTSLTSTENFGLATRSEVDVLNESKEIKDYFIDFTDRIINQIDTRISAYSDGILKSNIINKVRSRKQKVITEEADTISDLIFGHKYDVYKTELDLLVEERKFVKDDNDDYVFVAELPFLVALIERWKNNKLIIDEYRGYNNQSKIAKAARYSYHITSLKPSYIIEGFKRNRILDELNDYRPSIQKNIDYLKHFLDDEN
jgi:hypothetical protein